MAETTTPEGSTEGETTPPEGDAPGTKPEGSETPPWGDDFDPARAWQTIQNLRNSEKDLKAYKAEAERAAKEKADAEKTEVQRLTERLAELEGELSSKAREALVAKVAKEHGIPDDLTDLLTGDDEEAISAKAERLAKSLKTPAPVIPGKPKPRLSAGSDPAPDSDEAPDPKALADKIRAGF